MQLHLNRLQLQNPIQLDYTITKLNGTENKKEDNIDNKKILYKLTRDGFETKRRIISSCGHQRQLPSE